MSDLWSHRPLGNGDGDSDSDRSRLCLHDHQYPGGRQGHRRTTMSHVRRDPVDRTRNAADTIKRRTISNPAQETRQKGGNQKAPGSD